MTYQPLTSALPDVSPLLTNRVVLLNASLFKHKAPPNKVRVEFQMKHSIFLSRLIRMSISIKLNFKLISLSYFSKFFRGLQALSIIFCTFLCSGCFQDSFGLPCHHNDNLMVLNTTLQMSFKERCIKNNHQKSWKIFVQKSKNDFDAEDSNDVCRDD